jgi:hypothetical protein
LALVEVPHNISARALGGATGTTTSFMFVFTPEVYTNNTQFMWGTSSSAKRLSVHLFLGSVVALTLFPALKVVNGNFGKYAISIPVVTGTPGKL